MQVLTHSRDGAFSTLMSKSWQGDTHACLVRGSIIPVLSSSPQVRHNWLPSSWKKKNSSKHLIVYASGPRSFWHQGPASWKTILSWTCGQGGFWIIQAYNIYCVLYFYYYYISSTSDHQALDPGGWDPGFMLRATYRICKSFVATIMTFISEGSWYWFD